MKKSIALAIAALVGFLALLGGPELVRANGNYSHLWAAMDALEKLEPGDLREMLTRPELRKMIQNGANFADSGYGVQHPYGEIGHWEPYHMAYLNWIRANYAPPWSDEAAEHIAFLMGIVAHGMSDQLYDGMFLERHEFYDQTGLPEPMIGLDGATDACFAAIKGPVTVPQVWVPKDVMAPLFMETDGLEVDPSLFEKGLKLIQIAIMAANDAVNNPDKVAEYMAVYPYACGQQANETIPGTIPTHGAAIARFWGVIWMRLHGEDISNLEPIHYFYTTLLPLGQERDSSNPDSWVSFVMPFGLTPSTVNGESVKVYDEDGNDHPVQLHVYYGKHSHLVNIMPLEDWAEDMDYTVEVGGGIASWDGLERTAKHTFTFSTKPAPVEPPDDLGGDVVEGPDGDVVTQDDVLEEVIESPDVAEGDTWDPGTEVTTEDASGEEVSAGDLTGGDSSVATPDATASTPNKSGGCAASTLPVHGLPAAMLFLALALLRAAVRRRPANR